MNTAGFKRVALGWSRSGSWGPVDRDLGFLGRWPFRREMRRSAYWISLDFLGFSRPNRDFSMGCARFSAKRISRALCGEDAARERAPAVLACRGSVMGTSLVRLLFFCKKLSSGGNCLVAQNYRRPRRLRPPQSKSNARARLFETVLSRADAFLADAPMTLRRRGRHAAAIFAGSHENEHSFSLAPRCR